MNVQIRNNVQDRVLAILNKPLVMEDPKANDKVYSMGMAACQGLCITYKIHSKRFCK